MFGKHSVCGESAAWLKLALHHHALPFPKQVGHSPTYLGQAPNVRTSRSPLRLHLRAYTPPRDSTLSAGGTTLSPKSHKQAKTKTPSRRAPRTNETAKQNAQAPHHQRPLTD